MRATSLPATDPAQLQRSLARARRYAASRAGHVSFALVAPDGRTFGFHSREQYVSASVVKAMLLVAELRRSRDHALTAAQQARLGAMIHVSDNDAATATWGVVGGDDGMRAIARIAGMRHYDVHGGWATSQVTAADQARFFARIDRLVPVRHRAFARTALGSIVDWQRWGIPDAAPSGTRVYFKGGWRGTGRGQLVHQCALVERDGARWGIAILTDGSPSHGYGVETVRELALRLIGEAAA